MNKVLILGIGNSVMGDDGAGVKVIEYLHKNFIFPENIDVVDGGTLGLDLLPQIEESDTLILVDAVEFGADAGLFKKIEKDDLPIVLETKLSPHQMGVKDILAVSRLMGNLPKEMMMFAIQPQSIEMELELTPKVADAIEPVAKMIVAEVEEMGYICAAKQS